MKILVNLSIIFFWSLVATAQTLPTLKPEIGAPNDFSKADQLAWQKALDLNKKLGEGLLEYEKLQVADRKWIDSLETGYGPVTVADCSWYCGGGPKKISSSSQLKAQLGNSYQAENAHDFDLFTAWVPETKLGVVGQKLQFAFEPLSPRINKIIIYNGYIKNQDLWKANARVAKLKFFINGKATAILELADVSNAQSFSIAPLRSTDKAKDLVLSFEILEVYKGTKYQDVAISEINFDGLDVH